MKNIKGTIVFLRILLIAAIAVSLLFIVSSFVQNAGFGDKGSLFDNTQVELPLFIVIAVAFVALISFLIVAVLLKSRALNRAAKRLYESEESTKAANNFDASIPQDAKKTDQQLDEPRFFMLMELDRRYEKGVNDSFDCRISLAEICERFRKFACSRLNLYYSIEDIRRFIAGLSASHVLIMQGMSGTGKTSLAYAFGEFIKNPSAIVPIQPMWKERSDLLGYYNEFTKKFNETVLLQKMYEANYRENMFVVILDEMNIARVEYYFAEFLSLLEIPREDRRYVDVVSNVCDNDPKLLQDGRLKLPSNIWFIGTANNDDSTFAISDKVYDRAMIMNLDVKAEAFEADACEGVPLSARYFDSLTRKAIRSYRLTHRNRRRLKQLDEYMIDKFKITFGNRIMKQIDVYVPVYLAAGGDELSALDDIISKKVFRKLETQNPIYIRNNVPALCTFLDELFGYDKMPLCKAYLAKFERSA